MLFGIVTYAFMLLLDNLSRNSCMWQDGTRAIIFDYLTDNPQRCKCLGIEANAIYLFKRRVLFKTLLCENFVGNRSFLL